MYVCMGVCMRIYVSTHVCNNDFELYFTDLHVYIH